MTKQEARSYLDAMMKENKFVNPYREKALSIAIAALREQEERRWISVTERLPTIYDADDDNCVLAIHKASNKRYYHWRSVADNPFDFTYWTRTPQPSKGE